MTPRKLRAVVADDADVTRRHVAKMLSDLSVEVVATVANGVEAVQRCFTLEPDLLVCDLVMPKLSGVDTIRLVRARMPLQIIVITSHCDKAVHDRCLALGASSVLIKPVTPDALQQVLAARGPRPGSSAPTP